MRRLSYVQERVSTALCQCGSDLRVAEPEPLSSVWVAADDDLNIVLVVLEGESTDGVLRTKCLAMFAITTVTKLTRLSTNGPTAPVRLDHCALAIEISSQNIREEG